MATMPKPKLLDAGECALVVEYGTVVDPTLNEAVLALDAAIRNSPLRGIIETVPTYRSLMIHYDPLRLARADLAAHVARLGTGEMPAPGRRRLWTVPACYDEAFGEDLAYVAEQKKLTKEQVVRLHAGGRYRIYMFGFAPGLAYMGGGPKELTLPRRTSPREMVAANSLIIAGGQTNIMTVAMPSGWHILGRTPVRFYHPGREPVFLGSPGDEVTFEIIDRARFEELDARSIAGDVVARSEEL